VHLLPQMARTPAKENTTGQRGDAMNGATTTTHIRRRHAYIIGAQTNDNGGISAVQVRCPWCRGVHQHAWRASTDYAHPWCGTPGVGYLLLWPEGTPLGHRESPDPIPGRNETMTPGQGLSPTAVDCPACSAPNLLSPATAAAPCCECGLLLRHDRTTDQPNTTTKGTAP
jgi:hypothetical protein